MGRELRRKQARKEGKNLKIENQTDENLLKKLFLITILLVLIVVIIYFISAIFITKELDWFEEKKEVKENLITNTILASEIFKQKEEEYYVYFYDYKNEDTEISSVITSKLSESKVYKVDTNSALNNKYISNESNKNAKTLDELKVKSPTIIKISNDTIIQYLEGEEIKEKLK